jgi:ribosome-binding factor A
MANIKYDKLQELIRELAAEYFSRESNRQSLITVTGVDVFAHGTRAKILVTVLPESQQEAAVGFIHRQLTDFREYVMKRSKIQRVPFFEVSIDAGEKNRQRLDEIQKTI